jgi:hypothetical protein
MLSIKNKVDRQLSKLKQEADRKIRDETVAPRSVSVFENIFEAKTFGWIERSFCPGQCLYTMLVKPQK